MAGSYELRRLSRQYLGSPARVVVVLTARHDGDSDIHDHEFMEIVVVRSGTAEHWCMGESSPIGAGDVLVLRPGRQHTYRNARGLRINNCLLGPELLDSELAWLAEDPRLRKILWTRPLAQEHQALPTVRLARPALARCMDLLGRLPRGLTGSTARGREDLSKVQQIALFLSLLSELAAAMGPADAGAHLDDPHLIPAVVRTLRMMDKDLSYPWTLEELAGAAGLNESYFVRRFRAAIGLPPLSYLNHRRAELAAQLLRRTNKSILELGLDVGWESPKQFARQFKAHFGITATRYRQMNRGGS